MVNVTNISAYTRRYLYLTNAKTNTPLVLAPGESADILEAAPNTPDLRINESSPTPASSSLNQDSNNIASISISRQE